MYMLYELRIYTIHEGRMDAIQQRFERHTLGIFERLDIKVADFWIDQTGHPKLYYVMEYKNMEDRQLKWGTFVQDPEWVEVKRKSEESGPIVAKIEEIFMKRAEFFMR
ncbi:NIPSNAP family protein [Paenibacillus alkalitolerans]|uniref:NIPSNAP family protein n=1 Tax=Paenibacillus alkalitolerans TaxID=2799335 RepID=UPI001F15B936|nr:NIPSNAP family protein [Paenibacillus alkalitolerans]